MPSLPDGIRTGRVPGTERAPEWFRIGGRPAPRTAGRVRPFSGTMPAATGSNRNWVAASSKWLNSAPRTSISTCSSCRIWESPSTATQQPKNQKNRTNPTRNHRIRRRQWQSTDRGYPSAVRGFAFWPDRIPIRSPELKRNIRNKVSSPRSFSRSTSLSPRPHFPKQRHLRFRPPVSQPQLKLSRTFIALSSKLDIHLESTWNPLVGHRSLQSTWRELKHDRLETRRH